MATITQAQWKRYIARLRQINDTAAEEFRNTVISKGGYGNIERQKLIDYAYGVSTKYGEASAALSAEMYDAIAELSGAVVPSAVPAEITYQDVAKTVNGIIKKTGSDEVLSQGIGRLVKMAGTDTILSNAYRDRPKGKGSKRRHTGAQVAWIPSGDTCPFCLMLASKGWMNQTEWGARSHTEHIHANCDCTYAVRFNNNLDVEGYNPEKLQKEYYEAGDNQKDRINAMRREQYSANKDKINEQKRAAYAKRKEKQSLHCYGDYLRDVLGSAKNNNTKELLEIMKEIEGYGGSLRLINDDTRMVTNVRKGLPAIIEVDENSSIAAIKHERRHFLDDMENGNPGLAYYLKDKNKFYEYEKRGYEEELAIARELGYTDIAKKIEDEMEKRKREIFGNG